jgi:hypothetical protein
MALQKRANIANTAVRIFLQDFGADYDEMRGFSKYVKKRDLPELIEFFDGRCCYCGVEFGPGQPAVEDHLIPLNQTGLGLHAWGNIVPSCDPCNRAKLGTSWEEAVVELAGLETKRRRKRILEMRKRYRYDPPFDLAAACADLYAEAGEVAMALVRTKIKRTREASEQPNG